MSYSAEGHARAGSSTAAKATPFRETAEYKRGHSGEVRVAVWLRSRGWFVIPSYDYSGEDDNKAPRLEGYAESWVVPDLDCCRERVRVWVEVKTKASATYTRMTGRLEHGISLRLWRHYVQVQAISGCRVYLCFFEEDTGEVRMAPMGRLDKVKRVSNSKAMGWMVFFPRDSLKVYATLGMDGR